MSETLKEMGNIAQLKEYLQKKKIEDTSKQMAGKFDDVVKAAETNPKMQNMLQEVERLSIEKNAPKSQILKEIMEGAAARKSSLSSGLKSGMKSGLKSIPIVGGIAALGSALTSGEAGAAVVDNVVPGGVEDAGPREGSLDEMIENPAYYKNKQNADVIRSAVAGQQQDFAPQPLETEEEKLNKFNKLKDKLGAR